MGLAPPKGDGRICSGESYNCCLVQKQNKLMAINLKIVVSLTEQAQCTVISVCIQIQSNTFCANGVCSL